MFYTKYRPQKFSQIIKPNQTAEALANQLISGKVGHAYLFVGSRGTGKTTTARILAKAVNCKKPDKNGDPCDECENCSAIKRGNFLDMIEIDAASNRGIDDIRDLKDKIKLAPSLGKTKVYIIDEVHMLTAEAFNALLKTLEEPPRRTLFILCTTEFHKVPDTIKSRCQVFKFKRATISQLVDKLQEICKSENVKMSADDLKKIAHTAFGGYRDAETVLQQIIDGNLSIETLLTVNSKQEYHDFVGYIVQNKANAAISQVNKLLGDGVDLSAWAGELIEYLRDLLLIKSNAYDGLVETTVEVLETMKKQAESLEAANILNFLEAFIKANNNIKSSFITQLPLEMAVVELCFGEPLASAPTAVEGDNSPVKYNNGGRNDADGLNKSDRSRSTDKADKNSKKDKDDEDDKNDEDDKTKSVSITFERVEKSWGDVLKKVLSHNNSIQALLKAGKTIGVEGNSIILEVFYAFHKERLEHPKNKEIVESALAEVFGVKIKLKCRVNGAKPKKLGEKETGLLTDYNVVVPSKNSKSVIEVFDGGLPLK